MMQDNRTAAQIREHYELEKRLAAQLRQASRDERPLLYRSLYDELLRKLPHHPLLQVRSDEAAKLDRQHLVTYELANLSPFLRAGQTYMEIGPGDCAVALAVCKLVTTVYAVDVSTEITKSIDMPPNFHLALSSGCDIPVPDGTIDVAFSSQLMEHLHPQDAEEQLANIFKALAPGGVYLCITPNRLNGPHDVSRGFDESPMGLHLREYSLSELRALFLKTGFTSVSAFVRAGRIAFRLPAIAVLPLEGLLDLLPYGLRSTIASLPVIRNFLGVKLIGVKPRG
jgi:SAM-dependent methyltransferase